MLFKLPEQQNLNKLKRMDRKFENFYLPSLEKLIKTFERVALWCDHETADHRHIFQEDGGISENHTKPADRKGKKDSKNHGSGSLQERAK